MDPFELKVMIFWMEIKVVYVILCNEETHFTNDN